MTRTGPRSAAIVACLIALAACGGSTSTATEPGVTSNSILLGVTIAQSGPAAAYGTIANAANAYFAYVNSQGGVNGRKITYKILDDGYNPDSIPYAFEPFGDGSYYQYKVRLRYANGDVGEFSNFTNSQFITD